MLTLKELRKKRGWTQPEVAEKLGITYQAYGHYENGRRNPDIETLKKLADIFDVPINVLISEEDYGNYCKYLDGTIDLISVLKEANNLAEQYNSFPEEKKKEFLPNMLELKRAIDDLREKQSNYRKIISNDIYGYKIGIGFTDPTAARRYYEENAQFAPSSSGEDPTDDEIIQLANELYEEQKAHKKQ